MKVAILNQQDKIKVGKPLKDLIKRSAEASLKFFDLRTDVEISVMLTDNDGIRDLNKLHRNIDLSLIHISEPTRH